MPGENVLRSRLEKAFKNNSPQNSKFLKACPNYKVVIVKTTPDRKTIMRARCKSWRCEYCSTLNRDQWRSRIRYAFNTSGGVWQFVTFTAHRNWRGGVASYKNIKRNADKLFKRFRRLHKKHTSDNPMYVRVLENHTDGSIHVHAFIRSKFGIYPRVVKKAWKDKSLDESNASRWWKDASAACGMGFQSDVKHVASGSMITNYITKYISKSLFMCELPPKARRIQTSQNFPDVKADFAESAHKFEVFKSGLQAKKIGVWIYMGYEVLDNDKRMIVNLDDVEESDYYYA